MSRLKSVDKLKKLPKTVSFFGRVFMSDYFFAFKVAVVAMVKLLFVLFSFVSNTVNLK